MRLACGFEGVYCLHSLCVCVDNLEQEGHTSEGRVGPWQLYGDERGWVGAITYLPRAALMQGYTLVPFVDMVWVLAQKDAIEKQGPSANELLEAGQAQLQVHII